MNYQKFFSRFYPSYDHPNGELSEKYVVFSNANDQESTITGNANASDLIDVQQQLIADRLNEDEFSNTWNVPSPEETSSMEPLPSDEVRWFYKVKDDKIWAEFNGYDSLLIEEKYRLLPSTSIQDDLTQLLVTPPFEEQPSAVKPTEIDGPKNQNLHSGSKIDLDEFSPKRFLRFNQSLDCGTSVGHGLYSQNSDSDSSDEQCDDNRLPTNVDSEKIIVRGGLYEVDLAKMTCESIYWPGEKYAITRGLYFYDGNWQPLERIHGEIIEIEHLRLFGNSVENLRNTPSTTGIAIHRKDFTEFHIEWMSSKEIYLYWGGAPRQLVRSVTQKLGFYQSTGYRLRRGYRTRASMSEKPSDITHVVFIIHGIGQKMDESRIIRNTNTLRSVCEWLRTNYPHSGSGRAELFPAKWKAGARGRASGLLAAAAPPGAPALRRAINEAAMDVMYYTSPLYGKQVQDTLRRELNRLYTMFMARNPNFKGSFSAVAHSLGSVILYDLIINYQIGCEHCAGMRNPVKQKLLFNLEHLFCIGSPLGVFLAMRHPNPSLEAVLPKEFTPRLYNIFHSSDPVAYRLEPLISPCHATIPPVVLQPYDSIPINQTSTPAKSTWKIWSYVRHSWQKPSDENIQKGSDEHIQQNGDENYSPLDSGKDDKEEGNRIISYDDEEETIIQSNERGAIQCCSYRTVKKVLEQESNKNSSVQNKSPSNTDQLGEEDELLKREELAKSKTCDEDSLPLETRDTLQRKWSEYTNCDLESPFRLDYTLRDTSMANNYLSAITSHTSYWSNYDVAQFILSNLMAENKDNLES